MRSFSGARLGCFIVGLNAFAVGSVFSLGYLDLRFPSTRQLMAHPELEDVLYDVPGWMLPVGLVLAATGLLSCVVGWYSSPQWREGPPFGKRVGLHLLTVCATTWLAILFVVIVGRDSGGPWWVWWPWLLLAVAVPIMVGCLAWAYGRTSNG